MVTQLNQNMNSPKNIILALPGDHAVQLQTAAVREVAEKAIYEGAFH